LFPRRAKISAARRPAEVMPRSRYRLLAFRLDDSAYEQQGTVEDRLDIRRVKPVLRLALGAVARIPLDRRQSRQPSGDLRVGDELHQASIATS